MGRSSAGQGRGQSGFILMTLAVGAAIGAVALRSSLQADRPEDPVQTPLSVASAAPNTRLQPATSQPRGDVPMMARAKPEAPPVAEAAPAKPDAVTPPAPAMFTNATPADDSRVIRHKVAAGETLARIAARYRVTEDFIARLSGLGNKQRIFAGQTLRVVNGPFRVVVDKAAFRLDVYLQGTFVRSFNVGLGTNGSTPTGTWRVTGKLANPSWNDPRTGRRYAADDPDNPIGERWIGLEGLTGNAVGKIGFGIHGTVDPSSIGRNASLGCVRMLSEDVELLYDWVVEGHTMVEVK